MSSPNLSSLTNSLHSPVLFLKFRCPPVLVLSSPESIEECFTNHDQTLAECPRTITSDHFSYGYSSWIHTETFEAVEYLFKVPDFILLEYEKI
ncbi:hypothetical protein Bca52824_027408 [Brassica carinata]|uniref:Uncharacterized protein n=1 Tax=Brassica carinata TaxID=52824 RepID=A0A8X7SKP3_BRACI|nr:hypothetical protein Bca52824_027408 [Brassica carinata]